MNSYIRKEKGVLVYAVLMVLLSSAATVYSSFYMSHLMDAVYAGNAGAIPGLILEGVLFIAVFTISDYLCRTSAEKFVQACSRRVREDTFSRVLHMNINTFNEDTSAKYISVLNNDMTVIEEKYLAGIPDIINDIALYVLAVFALFYFSPLLAVIALLTNLLPMFVPRIMDQRLKKRQDDSSRLMDAYNAAIKDAFTGFEVIKSFNAAKQVFQGFAKINRDVADGKYNVTKAQVFAFILCEVAAYFSFYANYVIAAFLVIGGKITLGAMMGTIQSMNYLVNPVNDFVDRMTQRSVAKASIARVQELLEKGKEDARPRKPVQTLFPLAVEHVSFGYKPERDVLHDLSFTFERGKKYAIVGKSGCGKSTLVKLLMLYYAGYTGHIRYGADEARDLDKESFYQKVSMIHQNIIAFDDTLRRNITMFQPYPEEEVEAAVKEAGLSEFVSKLPDGLDSRIEENGRNLSGGERQRIAIARAFLHKMEFLVIDEATASLDAETASQIENTILAKKDLTALVITHKLNAPILRAYDEILVLRDGALAEHGTFEELMAQKGHFYHLYHIE
mgnify:FL=1